MSKSIIIVNYYYPPVNNGGVQRTYNYKKYLSQMGFDVSFITTNSYGVTDNDNNVYRFPDTGYDFTHSSNNSWRIVLFKAYRLMQVKFGLITDGKYYWKKEVIKGLDNIINKKRYDLVIASYPTPVNLEIGELIYKKYNIPLVVDYRDGLMYEPFFEIQHSFFVFKYRLQALERRIAKIASLHITVNKDLNRYYTETYPNVKGVVIPNGFDDEEMIDCEPLELPKGTNMLYTGSIGKSRKLYSDEELSRLLGFIFNITPQINFIFIGDYTDAEMNIFKEHKNVFVYDKTDRKAVVATQRIADALLLLSGPNGGTSGKLYEYLFSGKPILNIGGNRGVASIINGQQFGETVAPDDYDKIIGFIRRIQSGKANYVRGDLSQYTRRHQSEMLAKELNDIITQKKNKYK